MSFFRANRSSGTSHLSVSLRNGDTRNFLKYSASSSKGRGISFGPWISKVFKFGTSNLKSKDRSVTIEMDEKDPMNSLGIINNFQFRRRLKRKDLQNLLKELNLKYSENKENPLFENYSLPPKDEINKYSNFATRTQMFINIVEAIQSLEKLNKREIKSILRKFFLKRKGIKGKRKRLISYSLLKGRIFRAKRKIQKYKNNPKKLIKILGKIFFKMNSQKNGFHLFKSFFGSENLYVSSLFRNIHQFYGISKNRNFYGKSYGKFKVVRPLSNFLRKNQMAPANVLIRTSDYTF